MPLNSMNLREIPEIAMFYDCRAHLPQTLHDRCKFLCILELREGENHVVHGKSDKLIIPALFPRHYEKYGF